MSYSQGKAREITYFFRSGVIKSDGQVATTEFSNFSWSYCCYPDGSLLEDIRSSLAERLTWIYPYYNDVDYKIVVVGMWSTLFFLPLHYIILNQWCIKLFSDDQIDKQIPLNAKSIFDTTAVLDRIGREGKTQQGKPFSIFLVLEQNSSETDLSSISSYTSSESIKTVIKFI